MAFAYAVSGYRGSVFLSRLYEEVVFCGFYCFPVFAFLHALFQCLVCQSVLHVDTMDYGVVYYYYYFCEQCCVP